MKKTRTTKLGLSTETLRRLSGADLTGVTGGASLAFTCPLSCACPTMNATCDCGGGSAICHA